MRARPRIVALTLCTALSSGLGAPATAAPCPAAQAPSSIGGIPSLQDLLLSGRGTPELVVAALLDGATTNGISQGFSRWLQPGGDLDGDGDQDVLAGELNPGSFDAVRGDDGSTLWTFPLSGGVAFPITGLRLDDVPGQDVLIPEIVLRITPPNVFEFDLVVRGVSGATGSQLWSARYTNRVLQTAAGTVILDAAVPTTVRDLNADGIADVLVERLHQMPAQKMHLAQFEILSGRNGAQVGTFDPRIQTNARNAPFVVGIPDATGDGVADAIGATFGAEEVTITGYLGPVMAVAWTQRIALEGRTLNWIAALPLGSDGTVDLEIAFRCPSAPLVETKLVALDGRAGSPLWEVAFGAGYAGVSSLPDVNGDGRKDLLVSGLLQDGARAGALDGGTGGSIWQRDVAGSLLTGVGDADGDNTEDLLARSAAGQELLSGRTGTGTWTRPAPKVGSEQTLTLGGDVDGDLHADLLMAVVLPDDTVTYAVVSGADGADLGPRRGFLGGPLYARPVDLRVDSAGMDLLESFYAEDHPGSFAARPSSLGPPLWIREP